MRLPKLEEANGGRAKGSFPRDAQYYAQQHFPKRLASTNMGGDLWRIERTTQLENDDG
jgi:hypothetical protein